MDLPGPRLALARPVPLRCTFCEDMIMLFIISAVTCGGRASCGAMTVSILLARVEDGGASSGGDDEYSGVYLGAGGSLLLPKGWADEDNTP
jgi:hypothetical protein